MVYCVALRELPKIRRSLIELRDEMLTLEQQEADQLRGTRPTPPRFGVMIAQADLAVEYGYERLAAIQEDILWMCEAAHWLDFDGDGGVRNLDPVRKNPRRARMSAAGPDSFVLIEIEQIK